MVKSIQRNKHISDLSTLINEDKGKEMEFLNILADWIDIPGDLTRDYTIYILWKKGEVFLSPLSQYSKGLQKISLEMPTGFIQEAVVKLLLK